MTETTKIHTSLPLVGKGWIVFILGALISAGGFVIGEGDFLSVYLIMFMFFLSLSLGCLFLVALEYLGGAVWSTPFRRVSEIVASSLPIVALIAIPLLFGMHHLFHWSHEDAVLADKVLQAKSPYLNVPFFIIRFIGYFATWIFFYQRLTKRSRQQDLSKDTNLTEKNIKTAAKFMPLFAITLSIAAIDWMMSLEPHWFSTVYGVYYFSGTLLSGVAITALIAVTLAENGYLHNRINQNHYYSLGGLLFAFHCFWAYIAFCQYMLIWYANLPEETGWYIQHLSGDWMTVAIALFIIHFVIPFFGMASRPSKKNPHSLRFWAVWTLMAHGLDLYWLIMPTHSKGNSFVLTGGLMVMVLGIIFIVFQYQSKKQSLLAIGDPKLERGLSFHL